MTKETILENCQRIMSFYGETANVMGWITESTAEFNTTDLLKWYSRCLDVNGCPSSGVSLILLKDKGEYNEALNHCRLNFSDSFTDRVDSEVPEILKQQFGEKVPTFPARFYFKHNGYNWEIINK